MADQPEEDTEEKIDQPLRDYTTEELLQEMLERSYDVAQLNEITPMERRKLQSIRADIALIADSVEWRKNRRRSDE